MLSALLKTLYPPACLSCAEQVQAGAAFCSTCWPEAHFITGLVCDSCGAPLMGESNYQDTYCESCHSNPTVWNKGRAVALYQGPVRKMILSLKHGDRLDVAPAAARWMAQKLPDLVKDDTLVIPVPLHWQRLFQRKYNQAAVLAQQLAREGGLAFLPDALIRTQATKMQKQMDREQRYENMQTAIRINPRRASRVANRSILIVDDVMTSGATLSACAQACLAANARAVNVIVLARVARAE